MCRNGYVGLWRKDMYGCGFKEYNFDQKFMTLGTNIAVIKGFACNMIKVSCFRSQSSLNNVF